MLQGHLNKNKLHHAYLIEGAKDEILPHVFKFLDDIGVSIVANPDFYHITLDSLKIEDARNLKSRVGEMAGTNSKKIFLICVNSFLLEAQNTLLKIFEEPTADTHFFLIMPDTNSLLDTLVSRFYFIPASKNKTEESAEAFLRMPIQKRLDFLKDFLSVKDEELELLIDSSRSKSLKFLNSIEAVAHRKFISNINIVDNSSIRFFKHVFRVREFLRQPGSSTKTLMESVALTIPNL